MPLRSPTSRTLHASEGNHCSRNSRHIAQRTISRTTRAYCERRTPTMTPIKSSIDQLAHADLNAEQLEAPTAEEDSAFVEPYRNY